jgi:uncharacterized protein with PIN domain
LTGRFLAALQANSVSLSADCFADATASLADSPLLCTGEDFAQTDLRIV